MQDLEESFITTALESVLIGRHPHLSLLAMGKRRGRAHRHASARRVNMEEFTSRTTDTLSGGERRRVAIASLLAQIATGVSARRADESSRPASSARGA